MGSGRMCLSAVHRLRRFPNPAKRCCLASLGCSPHAAVKRGNLIWVAGHLPGLILGTGSGEMSISQLFDSKDETLSLHCFHRAASDVAVR